MIPPVYPALSFWWLITRVWFALRMRQAAPRHQWTEAFLPGAGFRTPHESHWQSVRAVSDSRNFTGQSRGARDSAARLPSFLNRRGSGHEYPAIRSRLTYSEVPLWDSIPRRETASIAGGTNLRLARDHFQCFAQSVRTARSAQRPI